jgi:uncharacterized damage-inducible protein DinB
MNLIKYGLGNLQTLKDLINLLDDNQFNEHLDILSGSSIGAHVRHILEFYACLLIGNKTSVVCYDARERNHRIETDRKDACATIDNIIAELRKISTDCNLRLQADFSSIGNDDEMIQTSLYREIAYCLEHSIHHMALIKIGIKILGDKGIAIENLGVAPSTARHIQNQLVQN